ncbi:MAG: ABC transporter permease [Candidatus Limnocylindrales bacterium]|jgi:ribose transport system permease protein
MTKRTRTIAEGVTARTVRDRAVSFPRRRLSFTAIERLSIFAFLVLLVVVFSLLAPGAFFTPFNLKSIAVASAPTAVMAVGMTYVMITGGIDLSVGSVLVLSGVCGAETMQAVGGGADAGWVAIGIGLAVGMATGALCGLINGLLVSKAHIPALIVTLGSLGAALGVAQLLTGGIDVRDIPTRLNLDIGVGALFGIPWVVVIAVSVALIGGLVLACTRFGRYTYAIGSNPEGARRAGLNVDGHLVKVYVICGFLAGLAGVMSVAQYDTTSIGGHTLDNLAVITAVVLGGTSLFGGIGTVFGSIVGTLVSTTLQSGLVIVGVESYWTQITISIVLVIAVWADQARRRNVESG